MRWVGPIVLVWRVCWRKVCLLAIMVVLHPRLVPMLVFSRSLLKLAFRAWPATIRGGDSVLRSISDLTSTGSNPMLASSTSLFARLIYSRCRNKKPRRDNVLKEARRRRGRFRSLSKHSFFPNGHASLFTFRVE